MPNCPNCNAFYFGSPEACPECHYNFAAKRVIQPNTVRPEQIKAEIAKAEVTKEKTLLQNPRYEYHTEFIADNALGRLDQSKLDEVLNKYADNGWKLHTIFVNETGPRGSRSRRCNRDRSHCHRRDPEHRPR